MLSKPDLDITLKRSTTHPEKVKGHIIGINNLDKNIPDTTVEKLARNFTALDLRKERETKRAARFEELSGRDSLTGLHNRRYLFEDEKNPNSDSEMRRLFEEARREGKSLSVVMFDGDHFKFVNDRFGHPVGDEVLRKLADAIKAEARASDIVIRYGGEEFFAVLPNTDLESARHFSERVRELVEKTKMYEGLRQTISAGVACFDPKINEIKDHLQLRNKADAALYIAKRSGRNQVVADGDPTNITRLTQKLIKTLKDLGRNIT